MSKAQVVNILDSIKESETVIRTTLLSDKSQKVVLRPMNVKDQKSLSSNSEGESLTNQLKALLMLVKSCIVESNIDANNLYFQDFVWLLMNIRAKSIGEIVDGVTGTCDKCGEQTQGLSINLEKDVTINYLEGGLKDNEIEINSDNLMVLRLPVMKDICNNSIDGKTDLDINACMIDYIEIGIGTDTPELCDLLFEDKLVILESLPVDVLKQFPKFEKCNEFGLVLEKEFTCASKDCKHKNKVSMKEEIISFF